jgi:acyl-CoA thioesterase YciA
VLVRGLAKRIQRSSRHDYGRACAKGPLNIAHLGYARRCQSSGDIFGGWVLSQMDIAAGICAGQRAQGRVATVAIDAMKFIRPVNVGDVLCVYTDMHRVGRTSLAIHLEAWVLKNRLGGRVKVTEGIFTFVAIDAAGKPRPVPASGGNDSGD